VGANRPATPSIVMKYVFLPAVLMLALGCVSRANKPDPGLQTRPHPLDSSKAVSQDQISAVVRNKANQAMLKSCYERALKMDNHLTRGRVEVTVSVSTSGSAQRVVTHTPSNFQVVESCIKGAVKRWVFPPSNEDYAVNFPLVLRGGM
jgi:outer membrane biosynthesis protein TonB